MNLVANLIRVGAGITWTVIVGLPLVVFMYVAHAVAVVASVCGAKSAPQTVIDFNNLLLSRVAQTLWAPMLLRLGGVEVAAVRRSCVDWSRPHVLCANHASIFDILALVHTVPAPFRFVAKKELLAWPVIGWSLRPSGQVVIDRGNRAAALRQIEESAGKHMRGQIIFFAEGTRSRDGHLRPFKKGAFYFAVDHDLPVLPTTIRGSHDVLGRLPWWRLRPGHRIEVIFGSPIDPGHPSSAERAARVSDVLTRAREQIAAELGESSTHGVDAAVESGEENRTVGTDRG